MMGEDLGIDVRRYTDFRRLLEQKDIDAVVIATPDHWDAIQAIVEFEGGAFCTFETSWIVPDSFTNVVDNRITVYGDSGGLEVKNEPALWAFTDRFHTPFSSTAITRYGKAWGYQYEPIRYFADCVAQGRVPESTGRDGLVVTAMIAATLQSLAERRPVSMADVLPPR